MTGFDADLYRRLVENSPRESVLVDAQNEERPVIYVNPGFETLTGYSAGELLGRNLRLLQAEDREQDGRQRVREALGKANPAGYCCATTARTARCFGMK